MSLDVEASVQVRLAALVDGALDLRDRDRRLPRQLGRQLPGARSGVVGQFVDQAERERLLRPTDAAAQDEVDGVARADQARQALGSAAAGQDAERGLGQAVAVVTSRRDADVAGKRQLDGRVAVGKLL